jgi:hypothetical protein
MKVDSELIFTISMFLLVGWLIYMQFDLTNTTNSRLGNIENFLQVKNFDGNINLGHFDSTTQNILVETKNRSNKDACLVFLHELGHKIDYLDGGFTDNNIEEYANLFMKNNSNRCDGI